MVLEILAEQKPTIRCYMSLHNYVEHIQLTNSLTIVPLKTLYHHSWAESNQREGYGWVSVLCTFLFHYSYQFGVLIILCVPSLVFEKAP